MRCNVCKYAQDSCTLCFLTCEEEQTGNNYGIGLGYVW